MALRTVPSSLAIVLVAASPVTAAAATRDGDAAHYYAPHVAEASQRFGIPQHWIWSVMRAESHGNARAVSPAGAMGLMQIMPGTWAGLRARHRLGPDPFDPHDNIMAGAAYLREMHDRYGNATAMLAAYNAGPGRYSGHLSRGRPLPAETRAYLVKLAAITDGAADTQLAATPLPDPFAWHRAALFATRSGVASRIQPDTQNDIVDMQAERPPGDGASVAMASITPPSTGLFVRVSRRSPQ